MSKKGPGMLEVVLAAQKEKSGGEGPSLKSLEDALSGVNEISAADLKKLLAGGSIGAPASNVIDIAQDIKVIAENSVVETVANTEMADNIDKLVEHQEESAQTQEEKDEQIDLVKEQNDLLGQIEENTREKDRPKRVTDVVPDTSGSGMLSGLLGFLGGGLAGGLLGGAAVGGIGKMLIGGVTGFIGKVFMNLLKGSIITMLVGGLANGLIDGIMEYKESGDFKEALWAGLAGFTEFLTFGFIGKEELDAMKDTAIKTYKESGVSGIIINSLVSLTKSIAEYIESTETFQKIKEEIDKNGWWASFSKLSDEIDNILFGKENMDIVRESLNSIPRDIANWIKSLLPDFLKQTGTNITTKYARSKNGDIIKINRIKTNFGYENTVQHNDKEYKVSDDTFDAIEKHIDEGHPEAALHLIKHNAVNEDSEMRKELDYQKKIINMRLNDTSNFDLYTGENMDQAGDVARRNNELEIAKFRLMDMANSRSGTTVVAPTTNVNNQTTVTRPVGVRDTEPALAKIYDRY